jgi:hypothetical protein
MRARVLCLLFLFPALLAAVLPTCAPPARPVVAPPVVAPPVVIPTATQAPSEPPPRTEELHALVWVDDKGKGKPRTFLLAPSPKGYQKVAEAPKLLVSDGSAVWRWDQTRQTLKTEPCDDHEVAMGVQQGGRSVMRVDAAKLGSAERVTLVRPPEAGGFRGFDHRAIPVASVGPYLFVRQSTFHWSCVGHGAEEVSFLVWDLAARKAADVLGPAERAEVETADRAEARRLFSAPGDEPPAADDVTFVASLPRYSGAGLLQVDHSFSAYMWGTYTREVSVPAHPIPERLRAYSRAPGVVSAFLRDHPDAAILGWSEVPAAALPAAVRELSGG